jgi:GntR family transcriptional repressor for pyruvate dehydrogenase complex
MLGVASRYQPLERAQRLSDRVATEIEQLIRQHELQPGERLPAERELGDAFGVSRTVIREAVRALAAKGRVEVRPGGGTIVRQPTAAIVTDALTFVLGAAPDTGLAHLREVRRVFEPAIAEMAAARRTQEDLRAMEYELARMRDPATSAEDWAQADVVFHAALARATHNPIFGIIMNAIHDLLIEVRLLAIALPGTREKSFHHHEAVLRAVRDGNAEAARRAMIAHLREAMATQMKATARQSGVEMPPAARRRRKA